MEQRPMLAPLLGAAGSLVSTFMGARNADKANSAAQANAERNIQLQKEFAQNGIQWKVQDAEKAGIHPLYALGASTTSFAPVSVGHQSTDFSGLASAGQNIGRAIDQTRNTGDKGQAILQTAAAQATVEGLRLDNDIKRAQLASAIATNATPSGRGIPKPGDAGQFDGQGDAIPLDNKGVKIETRRDATDPNAPPYIPGSGPSVGVTKNSTGGYSIVMPPELAESYESDGLGSLDWQIRNRILPFFTDNYIKPNIPHDPITEEVYFSRSTNDYRIRKKKYGPYEAEGWKTDAPSWFPRR